MNNRIKTIRESQKLNMEQFGIELGVTCSAISRIEKGERKVTDQMIRSICRAFNVNEEWLRTGQGEMYKKSKEMYRSNIQSMIDKIDDVRLLKRIYALAEYLYVYKEL